MTFIQDDSIGGILQSMQRSSDAMSIMAQDVCRALDIDIELLTDAMELQDVRFSGPCAMSDVSSDMDIGDA